jgi:hypothetical protein
MASPPIAADATSSDCTLRDEDADQAKIKKAQALHTHNQEMVIAALDKCSQCLECVSRNCLDVETVSCGCGMPSNWEH